MIESFQFRNSTVRLVNYSQLSPNKNIFSILVGKNGTGKSTLLEQIANDTIKLLSHRRRQIDHYEDRNLFNEEISGQFPSEVIAVSTSPFDKFPISRVRKLKNYTYLGLRDVNSISTGLGYLSKIIGSLIESIYLERYQAAEVVSVLEFLGYREEINVILDYVVHPQQFFEELSDKNLVDEFDNRSNTIFKRINRQYFINDNNTVNEKKLKRLQKVIDQTNLQAIDFRRFNLRIGRFGFENDPKSFDIENLIFLHEAGVLKLRDVLLRKLNNYEEYSIKEASSGEQSILLSILGIASRIKNNCLILIDEPEICLHPQWQETYIDILTRTFDKYQNCHFIIATHSPLIISRLPIHNSFVIDMETNEVSNAGIFIDKSADFQLASVFNYPGFKNEYLLRIAMTLFSNVSKNKSFSNADNSNMIILKDQSKFLRDDDPVYDLYKTLLELKLIYA
jgi:predicted ATPase